MDFSSNSPFLKGGTVVDLFPLQVMSHESIVAVLCVEYMLTYINLRYKFL